MIQAGNNDSLPPPGTYQYFTAISSSTVQYETIYDLSGIIFKVGGSISYDVARSYSYSYSQKTLQDFFNEIGAS